MIVKRECEWSLGRSGAGEELVCVIRGRGAVLPAFFGPLTGFYRHINGILP